MTRQTWSRLPLAPRSQRRRNRHNTRQFCDLAYAHDLGLITHKEGYAYFKVALLVDGLYDHTTGEAFLRPDPGDTPT